MNLKDRRLKLGFSQSAVAVKVGVSLNSYQNWERGVTKPKGENMNKLLEVLDIKEKE